MRTTPTDIHVYKDFRQLLKDRYASLKSEDPKFSHRYFCRVAGYGSSSAFSDILSGRRKLSATGAMRLARALKLSKQEEEYFLSLVGFNQSESLEEKNLHYGKLIGLARVSLGTISPDKYEYFSQWYHAAIREMLYYHPCKGDFKELGRRLNPPVPAAKVAKAVKLLESLGMIARDAKGCYRQAVKMLTTDDLGASLHLDNFQAETMRLAIEALDRHPRELRDLSTITATLSAESVEKVKAAIGALRATVLTLAEQDEKVDRVYQMNIQLFPLTRI